jgi:hypothetical protein
MPHHRFAQDDRHSFAPLSRFMTDEVQALLEVTDEKPRRLDVQPLGAQPVIVDLDPLWT